MGYPSLGRNIFSGENVLDLPVVQGAKLKSGSSVQGSSFLKILFTIQQLLSQLNPPPPRQPSGIVLASSAGGPGFNPQSRTASYHRRYKNGTRSALV